MLTNHKITFLTIIFAVAGLVILSYLSPQPAISNAAVVGFVVAGSNQQESNGIISNINGFLVKNNLPDAKKKKYLPVYIIANMVFIIAVITIYHKYSKKR